MVAYSALSQNIFGIFNNITSISLVNVFYKIQNCLLESEQDPPVFNNIVFQPIVLLSGFHLAGDSPNPFFLFMPRILYTLEQDPPR